MNNLVKILGNLTIPDGWNGDTNFIIADEKVIWCANKYNLATLGIRCVDPMAGLGTIPRIINNLGGYCIGIEVDQKRYRVAAKMNKMGTIIQGDCLLELPKLKPFDCIFTSLPFSWFEDTILANQRYAQAFFNSLKQDGFLLLETDEFINRTGTKRFIAKNQIRYLEENNFVLKDTITFRAKEHADVCEDSMVLMFKKQTLI